MHDAQTIVSELYGRQEYKFRLAASKAEAVFNAVQQRVPTDVNGSGGVYPVVSEYYDTPERDAYWERERRIGNRRKVRIRIYGCDDAAIPPSAFLEIKHKQDGVGVKRRLRVPVEAVGGDAFELTRMLCDHRSLTAERSGRMLLDEISNLVETRGLEPVMQMHYLRTAFDDPDAGLRITLDAAVRCRTERRSLSAGDRNYPLEVLDSGECLMEVKLLKAAPYWLRDLTSRFTLVRTPFSKYCEALARHDPFVRSRVSR